MIKSIEFKEGGYITPRKEKMVLTESGETKIKEYKKTHKESDYDRLTDIGWVRRAKLSENEDYNYVDQGFQNPQLVDNLLGKNSFLNLIRLMSFSERMPQAKVR